MSEPEHRPFRWEDLPPDLIKPKLGLLVQEMQKRALNIGPTVERETSRKGNSAYYLPRFFELHAQLTDEWARSLFGIYWDTWYPLIGPITPPFIRAVRDKEVIPLIHARKSAVLGELSAHATRTRRPRNSSAEGEWVRQVTRLANGWHHKLEAMAFQLQLIRGQQALRQPVSVSEILGDEDLTFRLRFLLGEEALNRAKQLGRASTSRTERSGAVPRLGERLNPKQFQPRRIPPDAAEFDTFAGKRMHEAHQVLAGRGRFGSKGRRQTPNLPFPDFLEIVKTVDCERNTGGKPKFQLNRILTKKVWKQIADYNQKSGRRKKLNTFEEAAQNVTFKRQIRYRFNRAEIYYRNNIV
jgi:hypothetical protein